MIEPPITSSPGRFSTGIDSPVTRLSSIELCRFDDPVDRDLVARPQPDEVADHDLGCGHLEFLAVAHDGGLWRHDVEERAQASLVPLRLFISIQWPKRTKVTSMAAASKKVSSPTMVRNTLASQAASTPVATSTPC